VSGPTLTEVAPCFSSMAPSRPVRTVAGSSSTAPARTARSAPFMVTWTSPLRLATTMSPVSSACAAGAPNSATQASTSESEYLTT
jgi:hypothetical protein